ncbi:hypothetical protein TI39_contig785g00001 [Zymoseptoria brevis]|uniref:Heterokaryon incompatibility domain-containing protein n=1 Tax=Zymoseptoria brevis TaxID=1047168 RepID=A0A0F4GFG4_9PEZI|nr:hypothetical protein TI39_contig785g00001 [Zymoseptoria brevis]
MHYPETYIWLDSICIDQEMDREQSHQVSMMKDIYVKADWVLACIGPHENGSEVILEVVDHVMRLDDPPTLAILRSGFNQSVAQWNYWLRWLIDEWSDDALDILRQALTEFVVRKLLDETVDGPGDSRRCWPGANLLWKQQLKLGSFSSDYAARGSQRSVGATNSLGRLLKASH